VPRWRRDGAAYPVSAQIEIPDIDGYTNTWDRIAAFARAPVVAQINSTRQPRRGTPARRVARRAAAA